MKDRFGRPTRSIRISITERCNQNCYYCHREGQPFAPGEMTPGEVERIMMVGSELGMEHVKFTGGEPLVRDDILDIVGASVRYMKDISLTTNGTLLAPIAGKLREAGLHRINISLDTLDAKRYENITGKNMLPQTLQGIRSAVSAGLHPVKVNIVVLADTSRDDVFDTIGEIWKMGAKPQVIEPIGSDDLCSGEISRIEQYFASRAVDVRERTMHKRKIYTLETNDGGKEVEVVRPMHNTVFCSNCTRIRVTSGGLLKPCLMHNEGLVDILGLMREGASFEELKDIFREAIMNRAPYWR